MACVNCRDELHWECLNILDGACCCTRPNTDLPVAEIEEDEDEHTYHNRTYKREGTLKDQQSTGRKRAARLYPLNPEASCEWRGLKNSGGGPIPIVGCNSGTQQARHHGPDKNTLNNDEGNVHRICHRCHNRWHTKNDPVYVAGESYPAHDSVTQATIQEIMESEVYWASHKTVKAKD
jgi:hypothetical protein